MASFPRQLLLNRKATKSGPLGYQSLRGSLNDQRGAIFERVVLWALICVLVRKHTWA